MQARAWWLKLISTGLRRFLIEMRVAISSGFFQARKREVTLLRELCKGYLEMLLKGQSFATYRSGINAQKLWKYIHM